VLPSAAFHRLHAQIAQTAAWFGAQTAADTANGKSLWIRCAALPAAAVSTFKDTPATLALLAPSMAPHKLAAQTAPRALRFHRAQLRRARNTIVSAWLGTLGKLVAHAWHAMPVLTKLYQEQAPAFNAQPVNCQLWERQFAPAALRGNAVQPHPQARARLVQPESMAAPLLPNLARPAHLALLLRRVHLFPRVVAVRATQALEGLAHLVWQGISKTPSVLLRARPARPAASLTPRPPIVRPVPLASTVPHLWLIHAWLVRPTPTLPLARQLVSAIRVSPERPLHALRAAKGSTRRQLARRRARFAWALRTALLEARRPLTAAGVGLALPALCSVGVVLCTQSARAIATATSCIATRPAAGAARHLPIETHRQARRMTARR
jgi:hypothetical protein